VTEKRGLI